MKDRVKAGLNAVVIAMLLVAPTGCETSEEAGFVQGEPAMVSHSQPPAGEPSGAFGASAEAEGAAEDAAEAAEESPSFAGVVPVVVTGLTKPTLKQARPSFTVPGPVDPSDDPSDKPYDGPYFTAVLMVQTDQDDDTCELPPAGVMIWVMDEQGNMYDCFAPMADYPMSGEFTGTMGEDNSEHAFGDCYLDNLPPGTYFVEDVIPVTAEGETHPCCTPKEGSYALAFTVEEDNYTEFGIEIVCGKKDGAADIYWWVDWMPDIDLEFVPMKFVQVCSDGVHIFMYGYDKDKDALFWQLSVLSAPNGAEYCVEQIPTGDPWVVHLVFRSETPGSFDLVAQLCDEHFECDQETFPLHFLNVPGADCDFLCP